MIKLMNIILLIFIFINLSYAEERTQYVFDTLGIETWENGKKSSKIQQWNLECSFENVGLNCYLKQNIFVDCLNKSETVVLRREFSTKANNLIIREFKAGEGKIDFTINYREELSECVLTFSTNSLSGSLCTPKSLRCIMVHRGFWDKSIQTIEDRLVEKTFYWKPKCGFFMRGSK